MHGHQSTTADSKLRIALLGRRSANQFDAWPNATGVLPTTAAAAQPFTQNGSCGDQSTIVFGKWPGQRFDLSGRPHQYRDQRTQQVRRNGKPRAFGNVVDLADQLQSLSWSDDSFQ